jgi:Family of unknown function (DUF6498)
MTTLLSAILLVAVNLVPLIGVTVWGWSLMLILVLYWLESGIVGVINVFKIARAEGPMTLSGGGSTVSIRLTGFSSGLARGGLIGFFILHYGMFWVVHGVFVFLLPLFAGLSSAGSGPMNFGPLPLDAVVFGTIGLVASHVVSFFVNYVGRREYLAVSPQGQMMSVYGRVLVLHITIIAGAFFVGFFGTPLAALALLIGLKTVIDLFLHLREHRSAEPLSHQ